MTGTLIELTATHLTTASQPPKRDSRRNFLWQLSALCVGALIPWKNCLRNRD